MIYLYAKDINEKQILNHSLNEAVNDRLLIGYFHFYDTKKGKVVKVKSLKDIDYYTTFLPFKEVIKFKGVLHPDTIINIEYKYSEESIYVGGKDTIFDYYRKKSNFVSKLDKCPDELLKQIPCNVLDRDKLENYIKGFGKHSAKLKLLGLPSFKGLKEMYSKSSYVVVVVEKEEKDIPYRIYEKLFHGYTFVKTYDLGDEVEYHLDRETFYKEYMVRSNLYKELRGKKTDKIGFKNKLKSITKKRGNFL